MSTTNRQFLLRTGLSLPAGSTTGLPPISLQTGSTTTTVPGQILTTPLTGSIEWDGFNLFVTENATNLTYSGNTATSLGSVRRTVAYTDSTMTGSIATYSASGTLTQAGATAITTDNAYVNSSSVIASAPYSGVALPPVISGRTVRIVNNTANAISVYPTPVVNAVAISSSSGTLLTLSSGSTAGLYPGMAVQYVSGTSGAFQSNTVIVSIVSSTSFTVDKPPSTALNTAVINVGTTTGINAIGNDSAYVIVPYTAVEFIGLSNNKWYTSSAAAIAASNGGNGSGTFTPGALVYSTDAFGSTNGLSDIATVGVPLLSGGLNTPPSYTALNLANAGAASGNTVPAYGILPIANGGTGTNGSGLNAAGATYNLVTTTATTINFATAGTTISIGATTGTTTINNNLSVGGTSLLNGNTTITGNLTVSGTQFISNTTNTGISDQIIELSKPNTGWLLSDNGFDVGLKYHYYKSSAANFIVTNTVGNGTTTTLTLADTGLIIPVNTIINLNSTLPMTGNFVVTASSAGSVSFLNTYNSSATTIGYISIVENIPMTTASSSGTTATINYAGSLTLVQASATVSLSGFSIVGYNGTYTVVTAGAGTFTINTANTGVATFGTIAGGSNYTNGTYNNVTLTLSSGPAPTTFPIVNITVSGNAVTSVTLVSGGNGATTSTVLTVDNARIGGTGSGFSIPVASVATGSNLGTPTAATGTIIVGDLYAFSGWANDSSAFEFYGEGYEVNGKFQGQYGTLKSGSILVSPPSSVTNTIVGSGAALRVPAATFYDSTSTASATNTNGSIVNIAQQTIASLNTSVTYSNAASLYIANAPTAGTNVTITNPYAIQVASGNTLLGGNLAVNGGTLSSTSSTFTLLNTGVGTLNALGAATAINYGGTSTTSYAFTGSTSGSSFTVGGAAASGNSLAINSTTGGTVAITTPVTTGTATIFGSVTGAINMGGASTTLKIGQTGDSTLTIAGASSATINTTAGVVTANVFNTTATIGNLFGAATAVAISSNATGTLTFGNAVSAGSTNTIKINANGGTAAFDAPSAGTATIFSSPTGLVTLGSGTTTVTIGGSGANVTIGNAGNSTLTVTGNGSATVVGSSSATTAIVFNTISTTGNLFGVATTLNIANSATTAITGSIGTASTVGSTYTIGGAITTGTNTVKIGAGSGGSATFDAGNAGATGNLFTSITGTINVGAAGSTTNFGTTSGISTVNINGSTAANIQASGAGTANIFNTSNTVLANLLGYATSINVAGSVATGTASTLNFGAAVTTGVTNKINIKSNGGTAAFDADVATAAGTVFNTVTATVSYSTAAAVNIIGKTTGSTTINSSSATIGNTSANTILTLNGNTTAGLVTVTSNVTTGSVNLFTGVTGPITIGGSSFTSGLGAVKLGISPSQLASGNEVVTANWVLNNITSMASTSTNTGTNVTEQTIDSVATVSNNSFVIGTAYTVAAVGTTSNAEWNTIGGTTGVTYNPGTTFVAAVTGSGAGTGSAFTGQAFTWDRYRSAKYIIQATQVGATSTRTQTSEVLVTNDAPVRTFTGSTASGTALTVTSTNGLFIGMTVSIYTNAGSDTINSSATGITTITAINSTTNVVTLAQTATITSGTYLKAFLATSFSASITAANSTSTVLYSGMSNQVGAAYPGMYITGTGVTAGTYITSITNTSGTSTINFNQALGTSAGAVISGEPNLYTTEYAVLETNGTIGLFTARIVTAAPYNIKLVTTPLTTTTGIALGALDETVFKLEKRLIENV